MCTHLCRWIWEKKFIIHRLSVFRRTHHRDITDTLLKKIVTVVTVKLQYTKYFVSFLLWLSLCSVVEPNQEKTSRGLERAFPDESQHPAAAAINGAKESTSHPISAAHPPNKDLICSIRAEVDKLMQDHTKSSSLTSSHTGKTKKHPVSKLYKRHYCRKEITFTLCIIRFSQASRGSLTSPSCTSSMRQATPAPVRGKRLDGRTAVTSRSSRISRGSATPAKTRSAVSSQCPHRVNHEDCWDCTGY